LNPGPTEWQAGVLTIELRLTPIELRLPPIELRLNPFELRLTPTIVLVQFSLFIPEQKVPVFKFNKSYLRFLTVFRAQFGQRILSGAGI